MPRSSKKIPVPDTTPTMREALTRMMRSPEKALYCWRGGFWSTIAPVNMTNIDPLDTYFGTSTVKALIMRGLVDEAERRTNSHGSWISKVRLNNLSYEVLKCHNSTL